MIQYVGNTLMRLIEKPDIEGFKRVQVYTLGTKTKRRRLCTLLRDGQSITEHNLNVKSFFDERDKQMNVVIRSNIRNEFDSTVVAFAVPFNGQLYPPKIDGYRYRNAFVVDVTEAMLKDHPQLAQYQHILYGVAEIHATSLDEGHKNHRDRIFINVISKTEKGSAHNTSIVVEKAKTKEDPDPRIVMKKKIRIRINEVDNWKVGDQPSEVIPWDLYDDPRVEKKKVEKKVTRRSFKKSNNDNKDRRSNCRDNSNNNRKPFRKPNQNRRQTFNVQKMGERDRNSRVYSREVVEKHFSRGPREKYAK